jgi:hypothetical protein
MATLPRLKNTIGRVTIKWVRGAMEQLLRDHVDAGEGVHVVPMINFVERYAVNTAIRLGSRKVDIRFVHLSITVVTPRLTQCSSPGPACIH